MHIAPARRPATLTCVVLLALLLAPVGAAQLTGFDSFSWTLKGDGYSAGTTLDDTTMTVVGPDGSCTTGNLWYETGPLPAGTVTVSLDWTNLEALCHYDWPVYYLDGVIAKIPTDGTGGLGCFLSNQFEVTIEVPPGAVFGLGAGSADCLYGGGVAVYTGFEYQLDPTQLAFWVEQGGALDPRHLQSVSTTPTDAFFGRALATPGDLDGDGTEDVVLGSPFTTPRVEARSGADGSLLWSTPGTFSFGYALATINDANDDGIPDIAVSNYQIQEVELLSGADGTNLWTWVSGVGPAAGSLATIADLDGDGIDEVAVAGNPAPVLSGADGSQIHLLSPGGSVATAFDVDDDGTADILVYDSVTGLRVFSGVDGIQGLTISEPPGLTGAKFGAYASGAGDVDGDGHADLLASAYDATAPPGIGKAGAVFLFSGDTGAILHTTYGADINRQFGRGLLGGLDTDGDGAFEWAAYQFLPPFGLGRGQLSVRDAADGSERFTLEADGDTFFGNTPAARTTDTGTHAFGFTDLSTDEPHTVTLLDQLAHPGAPRLTGSGTPVPGAPWSLFLTSGQPHALAAIVLGLSDVSLPFLGGVLVPTPDRILLFVLDSNGRLSGSGLWPAVAPPSIPIWIQAWVQDATAPEGWSASGALRTAL